MRSRSPRSRRSGCTRVALVGSMPPPDGLAELPADVRRVDARRALRAAARGARSRAVGADAAAADRRPGDRRGLCARAGRVVSRRRAVARARARVPRPAVGLRPRRRARAGDAWWGEDDVVSPPAIAQEYERRLPNATLRAWTHAPAPLPALARAPRGRGAASRVRSMTRTAPLLAILLALTLAAVGLRRLLEERDDHDRADDDRRRQRLQGRPDHRHRRAQRPQLQPPRLRRPAARGEAARRAGRVVLATPSADYIPNLSKLAQQGYNLVIGVGFTEIDAMKAVAKQFPKTHFAIVDVSNADEGGLKNVAGPALQGAGGRLPRGLRGRARRQAARRQGGLVGRRRRSSRRSTATSRASRPARRRPIPGVQTLNGYSQDFENQAKCKEVALNQIAAGSVVVFQVAGGCGLGALDAAKEKSVWGVGVDADQGYLGTVRPHLGAEARRHGGLRLDPRREGRQVQGRHGRRLRFRRRRRRASASSRRRRRRASRRRSRRSSSRSQPGKITEHPDDGQMTAPACANSTIELLKGHNFGVIATVGEDGRPQTSVVWVDTDGENVRLQHDELARQGPQPAREPARLDQRLGQRRPVQVLRGRRHRSSSRTTARTSTSASSRAATRARTSTRRSTA